jgi:hypothetical protein
MNELLKFHCDFDGETTCTITLDLVEHRRDPKNIRPKMKWAGERSEAMFPKYQAWMHTVNHRISEAIGCDHFYVIQTWFEPAHLQFWVYHSNGDKKLIAEADGKFDPRLIGR